MANEYLMKKWKLMFKCMDRTHAGQLTQEDEKREEASFVQLSHLEGERKKEVLETSKKLWNQFVFHDKTGPVTEEQYLERTNNEFKKDRKKFEEDMRKGVLDDFIILDQSREGSLTEEEFFNAYKAAGFDNEEWLRKFFQALNPEDGKVSNDVLSEAWIQYMISEDSSKKDVVLEMMESYPDL